MGHTETTEPTVACMECGRDIKPSEAVVLGPSGARLEVDALVYCQRCWDAPLPGSEPNV